MTRDTRKIVEKFASAMAAANMFSPEDMRRAALVIRSEAFSDEENDWSRSAINAFAGMLEGRANERERLLRETYGT